MNINLPGIVGSYLPLSGGTLTGDLVFADAKGVKSAASNTASILYSLYENGAYVTGLTGQNSATAAYWNFGRKVFVGDTANAALTLGLTLNQGAADDNIEAFKSSDIATGLSSVTANVGATAVETDDFATFSKQSAAGGGLCIQALAENAAYTANLHLVAIGGQADTTKSAAGVGLVTFSISQHDGANALANIAADGNIVAIRARVGAANNAVWILDEDGDTWQNGNVTAASFIVGANQVVGARVVDARCDDAANSGDATTDGLIDALRDAMIAHGLIAAA